MRYNTLVLLFLSFLSFRSSQANTPKAIRIGNLRVINVSDTHATGGGGVFVQQDGWEAGEKKKVTVVAIADSRGSDGTCRGSGDGATAKNCYAPTGCAVESCYSPSCRSSANTDANSISSNPECSSNTTTITAATTTTTATTTAVTITAAAAAGGGKQGAITVTGDTSGVADEQQQQWAPIGDAGDTYEGAYRHGRPHGKGKLTKADVRTV